MKKTFLFFLFMISLLSCQTNSLEICPEISTVNNSRPSQAISYKEMAKMFKAYNEGQKKVLNRYIELKSKGRDSISTIAEFFTINELKQYIAYVERLSAEKGIQLTGIEIFPAAYPSNYEIVEYRNRLTFMLAPTTLIDGKNVAFEPLKSTKGEPVPIMSILKKYEKQNTEKGSENEEFLKKKSEEEDEDSSGLNKGQVRPPN